MGRKEMLNTPAAMEAVKKEWSGLNSKCWSFATMREKKDVMKEAQANGEEVQFARAHTIMVEKNYLLDANDPKRKFKARGVCLGNKVTNQSDEAAMFADLGNSPATFAARWADLIGLLKDCRCETADGFQAYLQALLLGKKCWMWLPPEAIPEENKALYDSMECPVVLCTQAIYGHPDAGASWEVHCDQAVKLVDFVPLGEEWPSVYYHHTLKLSLVIYVDDFKLAGPKKNLKEGWRLPRTRLEIEPEEEGGLYLGCDTMYGKDTMADGTPVKAVTYDMSRFLGSCVDRYCECSGFSGTFPKMSSPGGSENTKDHVARAPTEYAKSSYCCVCPWCHIPVAKGRGHPSSS